jgi:hypothetical protein
MEDQQGLLFQRLIEAVATTFKGRHPASQTPIQEWRGQQIVDFQEDLLQTVQGRISEKWFYTHIKNHRPGRLPRIDMLNLLSRYAGYDNWQDFMFEEKEAEGDEENEMRLAEAVAIDAAIEYDDRWLRKWMAPILGFGLLGLIAGLVLALSSGQADYEICFVDADSGKPLANGSEIEVVWMKAGESPMVLRCQPNGCLQLPTAGDFRLAISAPYYKADTLFRRLPNGREKETVQLKTDDYALMIHLFSTSNLKDWEKRRRQLEKMFADEAQIFQVYQEVGVELYNKEEFIDKLTFPLESLKEIEVLETVYDKKDRIIALRFRQKE